MNIKESDLYNYVFRPDKLTEEKLEYLSKNQVLFEAEIRLLKSVKESLQTKDKDELLNDVLRQINKKSSPRIIELYKLENPSVNSEKVYSLAAASAPLPKETSLTETFVDEHSSYLIKIITRANSSKVYLFDKDQKILRNIRLIFYPSETELNMKNNQTALEVKNLVKVENIKLMFM